MFPFDDVIMTLVCLPPKANGHMVRCQKETGRWEFIDVLVRGASGIGIISNLYLFNAKIFLDAICYARGAGWK